jgi:exosortase
MLVGWALWSSGYRADHQFGWHFGPVVLVIGCFVSCLGLDVLQKAVPALIALLFMLPIPQAVRQHVAVPLQVATAHLTQVAGAAFGLDIERTGNLLILDGVNVQIAEACNGMRMIITLLMVNYAFAFSATRRPVARTLVLLLSPVTAIVCNVIRLIPTVWMFAHTSSASAERFHDAAGWVMLVVAFALLSGAGYLWRWAMHVPPGAGGHSASAKIAPGTYRLHAGAQQTL